MNISVVIPVCNEEENVAPLALEIQAALGAHRPFEILFVDDGSTDGTVAAIESIRADKVPEIRLLRHSARCGQSSAVHTGVRAARAEWVATLDGDGQNDPADIPALLKAQAASGQLAGLPLRLIMGNRTTRKDTWLRRISSRVANGVRGSLLQDGTPDTGCGIKLFDREAFLDQPAGEAGPGGDEVGHVAPGGEAARELGIAHARAAPAVGRGQQGDAHRSVILGACEWPCSEPVEGTRPKHRSFAPRASWGMRPAW